MNSMNRLMLPSPITIASVSLIATTDAAFVLMAYALIVAIQN